MKELPPEEYYRSLPQKRVAAGAVFHNEAGDLLILHKNYGDHGWNLPGGVIEPCESPSIGLAREIREEIGLHKFSFRFLGVNYKISTGDFVNESLQFIFDGGTLDQEDIERITLSEEHSEFAFRPIEEAFPFFNHNLSRYLNTILAEGREGVYLENGVMI
jgi:8-oxo-dGTP pyrophosphatase MutT (NUDIX family)